MRIASPDGDRLAAAKEKIMQIAFPPEVELGAEYTGKVVNITKFGAFVNILPGRDGLLHISTSRRFDTGSSGSRTSSPLGDRVTVVVRDIDRNGKVSLDLARGRPGG